MPNVKIFKRFLRFRDFMIFQDGGRPPSWIYLFGHIWTTPKVLGNLYQ